MMINIEVILFFLLVFSCLILLRHVSKFVIVLFDKEPKPITYSNLTLFTVALAISYVITYIVFK